MRRRRMQRKSGAYRTDRIFSLAVRFSFRRLCHFRCLLLLSLLPLFFVSMDKSDYDVESTCHFTSESVFFCVFELFGRLIHLNTETSIVRELSTFIHSALIHSFIHSTIHLLGSFIHSTHLFNHLFFIYSFIQSFHSMYSFI